MESCSQKYVSVNAEHLSEVLEKVFLENHVCLSEALLVNVDTDNEGRCQAKKNKGKRLKGWEGICVCSVEAWIILKRA